MSRRVIVTGVCGGLGAATAAAFQKAGWVVIGVDVRRPDRDLPVADFLHLDVAESESASTIRRWLGRGELSALVNNAAIQVNRALVETSDELWTTVMNTNLRSAFQMIRELAPSLEASRGAVVNISSVHAVATSENVAAYAVSKAALLGLTRTAALELAPRGVRCNAVLPGAVATSMLTDGLSRREHPEGPKGNLRDLAARTPLGFVASPGQIAPTIVHLADGDLSPYTTGQMLLVDGGASIRLGTE